MENGRLGMLYIVFGGKTEMATGHDLITFDTFSVGLFIMEISVQGKFFVQVSKEF